MSRRIDIISVDVDGDEIVVRKRGTVFLIAFKKAPKQRHLIVTRNWLRNFTSKPLAEFRAKAAQLALHEARSPGWTVEAAMVSDPTTWRRPASDGRPWPALFRVGSGNEATVEPVSK